MNKSEIYERAARIVFRESGADAKFPHEALIYSCNAISHVVCGNSQDASVKRRIEYEKVFKRPKYVHSSEGWGHAWSKDYQERQNCRITALCFASAMAATGDL